MLVELGAAGQVAARVASRWCAVRMASAQASGGDLEGVLPAGADEVGGDAEDAQAQAQAFRLGHAVLVGHCQALGPGDQILSEGGDL